MIRSRVVIEAQPIEDYIEFADGFDTVVGELSREAFAEVEPNLRDELRFYPGEAVHPFVWSSDGAANARARRWWFRQVRLGNVPTDGTRYIRQNKLRDSWEVMLDQAEDGAGWQLVVANRYEGTKWTVGTFDQRRDWQIPGHATTGWPVARETVKFWQDAWIERFGVRFDRVVGDVRGIASARIVNR